MQYAVGNEQVPVLCNDQARLNTCSKAVNTAFAEGQQANAGRRGDTCMGGVGWYAVWATRNCFVSKLARKDDPKPICIRW